MRSHRPVVRQLLPALVLFAAAMPLTSLRATEELPCELALAGTFGGELNPDGTMSNICSGNPSNCCRIL